MEILYEDNHIIVAVKPRGVMSQGDGSDKPDMLTILKDYIKEKYNKPGNVFLGLVHRLDTNTKGVMVFARTSKAASRLSEAIRKREFKKRYLATVEGVIDNTDYVLLENYIKKDEKQKKSFVQNGGDLASLEYKALKSYKIGGTTVTDVDILLHTGRFHQIRCQMANLGHPLYGDAKYGSRNKIEQDEFPLVAYSLEFAHPTTKEIMKFEIRG